MKLQLNKKNLACMVLTVTERVTLADARVLRAGFRKLLGTARTAFLIDATAAQFEPDAELAVLETQIDALVGKIRLIIVGPNAKVCQATNHKEGQVLLSSVMRLDKVMVPQLRALEEYLKARRSSAEIVLQDPLPERQLSFILTEHKILQSRIHGLEQAIRILLNSADAPPALDAELRQQASLLETRALTDLRARGIALEEKT